MIKKYKKVATIMIFQKKIKPNTMIHIDGTVSTNRNSGKIGFIAITDGLSLTTIQVVYKIETIANFNNIKHILTGSSVSVFGTLINTKTWEIQADQIIILNATDEHYLLQKKHHSLELLRTQPHLRSKTKTFYCIFKIRSVVCQLIHQFFMKHQFVLVNNPIMTKNNCESGAETFAMNAKNNDQFFKKMDHYFLTASGQLECEAFAQAFNKTYTFGPVFRAEKSNTSVHAAEFWMVEFEIINGLVKDLIKWTEKLIKFIIKNVLKHYNAEMNYLASKYDVDLINNLTNIVKHKFKIISYQQAINLLKKAQNVTFQYSHLAFGVDLQKEHEKYLCHLFKKPVFIYNFPSGIKSFYMKHNADQQTVASVDLLIPMIGELMGGSERTSDINQLYKQMIAKHIDPAHYEWYLNLRKSGYIKTAGFGLGLDRLLMLLTGMKNIRDVIPFPITYE